MSVYVENLGASTTNIMNFMTNHCPLEGVTTSKLIHGDGSGRWNILFNVPNAAGTGTTTLFSINNISTDANANGVYISYQGGTVEFSGYRNLPIVGYATSNGVMFLLNTATSNYRSAVVISKLSNDKIGVVMQVDSYWYAEAYVFAVGDSTGATANKNRLVPQPIGGSGAGNSDYTYNQTQLVPVPTRSAEAVAAYFPHVYYTPISQYRSAGIVMIGDTKLVTNGYIALAD